MTGCEAGLGSGEKKDTIRAQETGPVRGTPDSPPKTRWFSRWYFWKNRFRFSHGKYRSLF